MTARAPLVSLLTDFGTHDTYVGQVKAVLVGLCPRARLVDLTHEVPPQDVRLGALMLLDALQAFPPGAVHLAVVDPGVGMDRRAVALLAPTASFVGPDNGLLWPAFERACGADCRALGRAYRLQNPALMRPSPSATFHGRDVFAPAAAHLALGGRPALLGPALPLGELVRLALPAARSVPGGLAGEVLAVDRFGNCLSSILAEDLAGLGARELLRVRLPGRAPLPLATTYGEAPPGAPLALLGGSGRLEIAVRNGSAAASLALAPGAPVEVARQ
jgi:hypothetical protein